MKDLSKEEVNNYDVFVRDWCIPNPRWPDGREPHAGDKEYIARNVSWSTDREICADYNESHDPGPMSRKAEFEEA